VPDAHDPAAPAISVVLPTTDGWSHVQAVVEGLAQQVARCAGEVIVTVGDGPVPEAEALPDRVRVLALTGESVFALRALGVQAARGDVIAITEDHCSVPGDWCERLVATHAAYPDRLGVAGAVDNGSRRRLSDWANFFLTFGAYAPPLLPQSDRAMPIANASFKREALDGAPAPLPTGWLEFDHGGRLLRDGQIVFDDQAVVFHIQSPGMIGMLRAHFHNGRSTTGLVRDELGDAERRHRARLTLRLPWVLLRQTILHIWPKRAYRRAFVLSFPMTMLVCSAHAAGELTGLLRGAGRSPFQLD
jgi:hypothetical protein